MVIFIFNLIKKQYKLYNNQFKTTSVDIITISFILSLGYKNYFSLMPKFGSNIHDLTKNKLVCDIFIT